MVTPATATRVREEIVRLGARGLPVAEYSRAVGQLLTKVVPAEGTCLMTVDPATLLPTAEYVENGMPAPALLRMVDIELREPDFNKWVTLSQAGARAASLSDATRGELDASRRQREIRRPGGFSDELRSVLASGTGTWGQLTVFRERRRPYFSSAEVAFVSSVAATIADGLRRAMLFDLLDVGLGDVGLFMLDADDRVTLTNPAAERLLDNLDAGDRAGSALPLAVATTVRQARAVGGATDGRAVPEGLRPAVARVRTARGGWLIVRGSLMGHEPDAPVAVILEPARRAQMAPLMAHAYGLTVAERRVTELVARGLSTQQIAHRLDLSTYTVQDHLKSIFAKSDTSSRGDLVARLFVDHYADTLTSDSG